MSTIVLLEKASNQWSYLHDDTLVSMGEIQGTLYEQFVTIISFVIEAHDLHDEDVIFTSNALVQSVYNLVTGTFSGYRFVRITSPDIFRAFQRTFKDAREGKRTSVVNRGETLYVCSDASYNYNAELAGWAWVSNHPTGQAYNFGVSHQSSTVLVELEGILRAVMDNRKVEDYSKLHVYCDSMQSVALANMIVGSYRKWDFDFVAGLQKKLRTMADTVHDVAQGGNVKISWIKGHANHRLNIAADFLSREVWKSATRGDRLKFGAANVQTSLEMIRR